MPSASAASPTFDARAAKYPLRWSPELKLDNIGAVAAAMNEKMRNGTVVEMSREGSSAPPERRSVTTCAEYEKAIADGFDAQTTYDRSMESFFLARCTPLRFLSTARPSLTSYVSGLRMDRDPLGLLPASMSIQMESPSDEQKDAIAHGQRLKAYEPRLVVKSARATSLTFADPESKIDSQVDVAAFGDFDHDGIEDVLLFQSFHALEGSLRGYWHVIVTRKGPHEPLMTLQKIERGTSASP